MNKLKLLFIIPVVLFTLTGCLGDDTEYAQKSEYSKLNIQQLHNDYDSNEITAKDNEARLARGESLDEDLPEEDQEEE